MIRVLVARASNTNDATATDGSTESEIWMFPIMPDTERRGLPEWGLLGRCYALPMDALAVLLPDDGTGSAE